MIVGLASKLHPVYSDCLNLSSSGVFGAEFLGMSLGIASIFGNHKTHSLEAGDQAPICGPLRLMELGCSPVESPFDFAPCEVGGEAGSFSASWANMGPLPVAGAVPSSGTQGPFRKKGEPLIFPSSERYVVNKVKTVCF